MKTEKVYLCECGKTFTNPQAFNGHKHWCKVHLVATNKEAQHEQSESSRRINAAKTRKKHTAQQKAVALQKWLELKPVCERCGVIMTAKFGSGRFCSRSCANAKTHSEKTKQRIRNSCIAYNQKTGSENHFGHLQAVTRYLNNPKHCSVCGTQLSYEQRYNTTCSKTCHKKLLSQIHSAIAAKVNDSFYSHLKNCRSGYFKGIHCDSSWELALLVYCIDHNIAIQRNHRWFNYFYENAWHKYFPDFIINDTYIEVKGFNTPKVQAKIEQFPKNLKYKILYESELQPCLVYCKQTYGNAFWEILYDS